LRCILCAGQSNFDARIVGERTVAIKSKDVVVEKGRRSAVEGVEVETEEGVVTFAELARLVMNAEA